MSCFTAIFCASLAMPATTVNGVREGPTIAAVAEQLEAQYPVKDVRQAGELQFDGPLTPIDVPEIRQADPRLKFFRTEFDTGHFMCYPRVRVVVAAWYAGGTLKTVECLSPDYQKVAETFTSRLCELRAPSADRREGLAKEIGHLFAVILHEGRLGRTRFENDDFIGELWSGDLHFSDLRIAFNDAGTVLDIDLGKPENRDGNLPKEIKRLFAD
jgi:hypothetical protein